MRMHSILGLLVAGLSLMGAAIHEFRKREASAAKQGEELPPIRYDDDPTEIYLA